MTTDNNITEYQEKLISEAAQRPDFCRGFHEVDAGYFPASEKQRMGRLERNGVDREMAIASIQKHLDDIGFPEGDLSIKDGKLFVGNEPVNKTDS